MVVNIIICDDNKKDLLKVEKIVDNYMMSHEEDYKKYLFNDYNRDFNDITVKKLSSKIYIMDIQTPSGSGIDTAREIRKKDIDSIIIFLTGHEELGNIVLKNDLMFLSFINKFDNCENRLFDSLDKAFQIMNKKQVLRFNDRNTVYTIRLNEIVYITKESFERKTIIKTDYTEFKINISLMELKEMLDERFIQTHRSCIVNKNRIASIDKQSRIITFDTGETIDLISDRYRKELV